MGMKNWPLILVWFLMVLGIPKCHAAAEVSLTRETPCFPGQSCRLRCAVTSGTNVNGLHFYREQQALVRCTTSTGVVTCSSEFPSLYVLSQGSTTSYLDISSFNPRFDVNSWHCSDGELGTRSSLQVVQNFLPSGVLTFGSTCQSGRVTSPASLSCSGLSPGVPNATVTLQDSSSSAVGSSQTGSVTGTVTRGGQYTCSVSWSALPSYTLNISSVSCEVQVAPTLVPGAGGLRTVNDSQPVTLTCDSSGYPRPTFTWSRSGSEVTTNVNDTVARGTLTLTPRKEDGDRQTVVCNSTNAAGWDSATFTLNVQYLPSAAPVISNSPPGGIVYEGDDVTLTCQVTGGNPPVSSVTLTCPRHSNTSQGDVTRLQFTTDRRDQGSCVCSASHILGYTQTASVNITTFYAPTVTSLTVNSVNSVTVDENEEWTLRCDVTSNPSSTIRLRNETSSTVLKSKDGVLTYQHSLAAQCLHAGNYTCDATNTVSTAQASSPVQLLVRCSPRQDLRVHDTNTTLTSGIGGNVTFTLPLVAFPFPRHLWYRQDNNGSGDSEPILGAGASSSGLTASLTLTSVQQRDFGLYFLNASNQAGAAVFTFELNPEGAVEERSSSSAAAVAGGVVGGAALLVLGLLGFFLGRRTRQRDSQAAPGRPADQAVEGAVYSGLDPASRQEPRDAVTYQSLTVYENQRHLADTTAHVYENTTSGL